MNACSMFSKTVFMLVFLLSQSQHYISLFSVFLVLWHLKALQTQGETAAARAGWFLKIMTFSKSMPFKGKATDSKSMYPIISLSDSHTPRQYFPLPKSSEGQASGKKRPLLWPTACRNCSDQPVLNTHSALSCLATETPGKALALTFPWSLLLPVQNWYLSHHPAWYPEPPL